MKIDTKIVHKTKRPLSIIIICIIGLLMFLMAVPLLYESYIISVNNSLLAYYSITIFLSFIAILGIWKMKRIALFMYTSIFIVNQLVLIVLNQFDIYQSLIPGIIIIVGFCNFQKMSAINNNY
jgi:hypothetical protein